jgi:hypothetical protein
MLLVSHEQTDRYRGDGFTALFLLGRQQERHADRDVISHPGAATRDRESRKELRRQHEAKTGQLAAR